MQYKYIEVIFKVIITIYYAFYILLLNIFIFFFLFIIIYEAYMFNQYFCIFCNRINQI